MLISMVLLKEGPFKTAWPEPSNFFTCITTPRKKILKLDFEKAFDKVEHEAIIQILKHKGFSDKWVGWMHSLLNSSESYVLLNGIPDKPFLCNRGVSGTGSRILRAL